MIGLLFSGQGAQKTGLTEDLYQSLPKYRQLIDQASTILELDLSELLFAPDKADQLAQTQYAQPAIFTMSYGLYQLLSDYLPSNKLGIGLSLGEYSALACAAEVDFTTALHLIKKRGQLMQRASEANAGTMIAVMKSSLKDIQTVLAEVKNQGRIGIANVNTPSQIVVGGDQQVVDIASKLLTAKGARIVPLQVSGAFHTPLMASIQTELKTELQKVSWQKGTFPVFSTTTREKFSPTYLTDNLTEQLVSTTYFADTLAKCSANLNAVIEVGPGRTLISFARKVVPKLPAYRTDNLSDLQKTISALEAMN